MVDEDDSGVTINGLKMLGTASVFCHETWCGNLQPVAAGQEKESITCAVPLNAPGVSIWSRKPYERYAVSEFDNPLAARFDETDSAVLFENVKVPWERVFCHDNVEMTRAIYMRTPGHAMANHQANVRFLEKLKLIVGIAKKLSEMNNVGHIPAVQFTLGRLAAHGGDAGRADHGPDQLRRGSGAGLFNRQPALCLCRPALVHQLPLGHLRHGARTDGRRRVPDAGRRVGPRRPKLRETFETYWSVPGQSATDRMKLFKLAWDLLGSDFAGRHMQYEKFYAGPSFVMNSYSYLTGPWKDWTERVDRSDGELRLNHIPGA